MQYGEMLMTVFVSIFYKIIRCWFTQTTFDVYIMYKLHVCVLMYTVNSLYYVST